MQSELDGIQGTWDIVTLEVNGAPMDAGAIAGSRIIVTGDSFTTEAMGAVYRGTVRLDGATSPKSIDLLFTEGPEQGNANHGIYERHGDEWTICLNMMGGARPREFATTPDSGCALETLRRSTGESSGVAAPAKGTSHLGASEPEASTAVPEDLKGDALQMQGEWSPVSIVINGQPLAPEFARMTKRTQKGSEVTVSAAGQVMLKANITLDPSTSPKSADYTLLHGPAKGQTQLGIYEITPQSLRLCFAAVGQDRPKDFSYAPGDGRTVSEWTAMQ